MRQPQGPFFELAVKRFSDRPYLLVLCPVCDNMLIEGQGVFGVNFLYIDGWICANRQRTVSILDNIIPDNLCLLPRFAAYAIYANLALSELG